MASSAVSMRASRATWLTHADTSVTAGPLGAVELVDGVGDRRRAGRLAGGDGGEDLAADAAAAVALVDAAGLGQLVERRRLALGDAEDGQVGQHLAHRRVGRRRLPLAPRRHGLGDGPRP